MATKNKLAKQDSSALAAPQTDADALAALADDLGSDGLEDTTADDWKLPVRLLNMKGLDANKQPIQPNVWFDTVAENTREDQLAVCLAMTKTREFRVFDEKENKSRTYCRSRDNVHGEVSDDGIKLGLPPELKCQGCPNYEWTTDPETGKRGRKCGDVYNTAWLDQETGEPFVIRFRRTGIKPWKTHLQKHHLGRLVTPGKPPRNVPLFAVPVRIKAEMEPNGKYALPVLQPEGALPIDLVRQLGLQSQTTKEAMGAIVEHADTVDRDSGADSAESTRADQFVD